MRRTAIALILTALAFAHMLVGATATEVQTSQPAFRGGTALVEVSAVVTADGQSVTDLKPSEVQVLDNGDVQPLVAFEYVDLETATGAAQRRDFVLMLDDLHVHPTQTKAAQDVARAFVDMLGPHDRLAIVNTSPHELVMQLSTDREQARSLIKKFRGQMGSLATIHARDAAARIHLQVLRNVALAMKGNAAERRAVLVISEGYPIQPSGDGRLNEPDSRVREDFLDVLRQSALANVAVYGINPTGLVARSSPIATSYLDSANAAAAQAEGARVAEARAERRYGSVGQLADSTGGLMTIDRNSLEANLPRLLQDSRRYYRLAYVQPEVAGDARGKARRIEVRVLRENVEVRARKAYLPSP